MKVSPRLASRIAASVVLLTLAATIAHLGIVLVLNAAAPYENATSTAAAFAGLFPSLVFVAVGGLIAMKRPGNAVGWALLLPAGDIFGGVLLFGHAELALFARPHAGLPGGVANADKGRSA